jgi:hypothetical protein
MMDKNLNEGKLNLWKWKGCTDRIAMAGLHPNETTMLYFKI